MNFDTLLTPAAIRVTGAVSSKKRLFQEAGDLAAGAYDLEASAITDALRSREALGTTGVGHGVALPHARVAGLTEVRGLFILLDKPIDFDAIDREPVDITFSLLAPHDAGVDHLKALALVSRTLRDPTVCSKLRANRDNSTLFTILSEAQSVTST